jgi:hypothetical protein
MTQVANREFADINQVPRRGQIVFLTNEDHECSLSDRAIRWTGSGTADNTITLPPVGKAAGLTITISATIADTAQVTVEDYNDDSDVWTDVVLDVDNDRMIVYSDGVQWWQMQTVEG